jgi:hypothetical protein
LIGRPPAAYEESRLEVSGFPIAALESAFAVDLAAPVFPGVVAAIVVAAEIR